MGTIANNDNLYGVSKWIVNPTSGKGTHTTVQAAITAASAGDSIFIMPGTYTENITLKNGVNLCGLNFIGGAGERTVIVGKLIDNGVVVNATIDDISLKTNSDNILTLTASGTTITCNQCFINCSNNTGISVSAGVTVNLNNCKGDLGTTGIGYWTGAGTVSATWSSFSNSGSSLTASTTSGGVNLNYCTMNSVLSTSSTGAYTISHCRMDVSAINTAFLTTAGTGTSIIDNSMFFTGTASSISIGTGTTVKTYKCTLDSTNTNPVTGLGTYVSDETTYSNTGILPNASTRTFAVVGENSAWTPVLTFGGGSTGLTYAARSGSYTRIGNVVTFTCDVELSAKGSSTGSAQIAGLPYTPAATTICVISASSLTYIGQVNARMAGGNSALILDSWATTAGRAQLQDTAFVNATFVQISGSYLV